MEFTISPIIAENFKCEVVVIFDANTLTFCDAPYDNSHLIVIEKETSRYISIYPYIKHAICQACNHERRLFRDGMYSDETPRYIDTLIGHRTKCM